MNLDTSIPLGLGNMRAMENLGDTITGLGKQQREINIQNAYKNAPSEDVAIQAVKKIDADLGMKMEQTKIQTETFKEAHRARLMENKYNEMDHIAGVLEGMDMNNPGPDLQHEWNMVAETASMYGIKMPTQVDALWRKHFIDQTKGTSGRLKELKAAKGGTGVWAQKSAELTAINAMEEGPDKEQAKQDFLLKSSYPTYYNASPEKVAQEGKIAEARATAQIGPGLQLAQGKMGIELEGEKKKKDITNEPSVPEVRKQKATIENTLSVFNEISTNVDKFTGPAGAVSAAIPGTDAYTYRKKVESFINGMVIPLLAQQKGPQTDTDMRNMRSAMTILGDVGVQLNREQFKKELLRVKDVIDRNAKAFSKEGIKTEQITVSDTSAIDAFFKARKK